MRIRLHYNSPAILTFSLAALVVLLLDMLIPGFIERFFVVPGYASGLEGFGWLRLFTHVLGHADWAHLFGNLALILLLGPLLEEKYGSRAMAAMIVITALVTGILNVALFSTGLLGASGIVFMLIVLASIVDIRSGHIPLTFVLVAVIFVGRELVGAFREDDISQMAHVVGGAVGAVIGFAIRRR